MLEPADLLGIALLLIVLPPGRDSHGARRGDGNVVRTAVWALKVCFSVALIVGAFTEKLANPALAQGFLRSYPAFNVLQAPGAGHRFVLHRFRRRDPNRGDKL